MPIKTVLADQIDDSVVSIIKNLHNPWFYWVIKANK